MKGKTNNYQKEHRQRATMIHKAQLRKLNTNIEDELRRSRMV